MEIVPDTKYAIRKMLLKYCIVYAVVVIVSIISVFLFFRPTVYSLLNIIPELLFESVTVAGFLRSDIIGVLVSVFVMPICIPLFLFIFEFFLLKTRKIKIILVEDGLKIYHGNLVKSVTWSEYSNIVNTSIPSRIRINKQNNLVVSHLFNKQEIYKAINLFQKSQHT